MEDLNVAIHFSDQKGRGFSPMQVLLLQFLRGLHSFMQQYAFW